MDNPTQANLEQAFASAYALYVNKDYAAARQALAPLAQQSHAHAEHTLGFLLWQGLGGPVDAVQARSLFWKAIAQKFIPSFANLGAMYIFGAGGAKDYELAFHLCSHAMGYNDSEAFNNMGWLFEQGLGVPENPAKAFELYQQAISIDGNADAQEAIGCLYRDGRGTTKDLLQATHYFNLSAAQGNEDAKADLAALAARKE